MTGPVHEDSVTEMQDTAGRKDGRQHPPEAKVPPKTQEDKKKRVSEVKEVRQGSLGFSLAPRVWSAVQ